MIIKTEGNCLERLMPASWCAGQGLAWSDEIDYYRTPHPRYSGWDLDAFMRHNSGLGWGVDEFLELAARFMHAHPETGWCVFKDLRACADQGNPGGKAIHAPTCIFPRGYL
jgi:hypothetical protein